MLGVGEKFPAFSVPATVSADRNNAFRTITSEDYPGKWKVFFFWPKDFTSVCPTELAAFDELAREFQDRNAQVLGCSTDSEYAHLAWRQQCDMVKDARFPMLADVKRDLCSELGVLDPKEGVAQRATFIVDPEGVIRFVSATDLNVGRNTEEVLRVLDALQMNELCPCNWQRGDPTLVPA